MKKIAALTAVLMLAGCASAPKPSVVAPKKKAPAIVKVAPVEQPTPNQVVKKRGVWDRFKPAWLSK